MAQHKLYPKITSETLYLYILPIMYLFVMVFSAAWANSHFFFPIDDSYVHLKQAGNLLHGHFFSYSRHEPPTNSNTSVINYIISTPLWFIATLITNTVDMATNVIVIETLILNIIFFLIFVKSLKEIIGFCGLHGRKSLLVALAAVTVMPVLFGFSNGLETGFTTTFVTFQLYLFLRRKVLPFTIVSVILSTNRPENIVLNLFYILVIMFFQKQEKLTKRLLISSTILLSIFIVPILNLLFTGDIRTAAVARVGFLGIAGIVYNFKKLLGFPFIRADFIPPNLYPFFDFASTIFALIMAFLLIIVLIKIVYKLKIFLGVGQENKGNGRIKKEFMLNPIYVVITVILFIGLTFLLCHKSKNPEFFGRYSTDSMVFLMGYIIICISFFTWVIFLKKVDAGKGSHNSSIRNSLLCLGIFFSYCTLPMVLAGFGECGRYVSPVYPLFVIAIINICNLSKKALNVICIINIFLLSPFYIISYFNATSNLNTMIRPVALQLEKLTHSKDTVAIDTAGYPSLFIRGKTIDVFGIATTRYMKVHGQFDKVYELIRNDRIDWFVAYPTNEKQFYLDSEHYRLALGEGSFREVFRSQLRTFTSIESEFPRNLAIYKVEQKQW